MATSFINTTFTGPVNLDLPNAYDISLPLPVPPDATPKRVAGVDGQILSINSQHDWPLSCKEIGGSQTFFVRTSYYDGNDIVLSLDTAQNMIPYFPGVVTGNVYKLEFVNLGYTFSFFVRGCTGSNTLGVTGSVECSQQGAHYGFCQPVYIRWDNVSGSTGSYTII